MTSLGRLFQSLEPAARNVRPIVASRTLGTSSRCVHTDRSRCLLGMSAMDKVIGQVLQSQSMQGSEDQHRQLELYALRRAQPVKAGERLSDVV